VTIVKATQGRLTRDTSRLQGKLRNPAANQPGRLPSSSTERKLYYRNKTPVTTLFTIVIGHRHKTPATKFNGKSPSEKQQQKEKKTHNE
jgi:hypothetical protein